jgi:hypothetical protein
MDYYQKDCQWCLNIICLKLQKIAADENTSVDSLRDDVIRSAGNVTTEGGFTTPQFIDVEDKKKKVK